MVERGGIVLDSSQNTEQEQPGANGGSLFEYLVIRNRSELVGLVPQCTDFRINLVNAQSAYNRFSDITKRSKNRLDEFYDELTSSMNGKISSATVSKAYLKFTEDLSHLSQEELWDFFERCLEVNTQRTENLVAISPQARLIHERLVISGGKTNHDELALDKKAMAVPSWFKGSKIEWQNLFSNYSSFGILLNTEHETGVTISRNGKVFRYSDKRWLEVQ